MPFDVPLYISFVIHSKSEQGYVKTTLSTAPVIIGQVLALWQSHVELGRYPSATKEIALGLYKQVRVRFA